MHMAAFNLLAVFVAAALCSAQAADFGMFVQNALKARAKKLTGVRYLGSPASEADYVPRENATAMQRVKLSKGLKAEYVARNVGYSGDMLACTHNFFFALLFLLSRFLSTLSFFSLCTLFILKL